MSKAFALCLLAVAAVQAEAKQDTVTLIFTNDMHAQDRPASREFEDLRVPIGGLEGLSAYVKKVADAEEDLLFLDAGDHFTGTPICTFSEGRAIIEIMNRLGVDVAVLGNHEFDFGQEALGQRIAEAKFDYVSANVYRGDTLFAPAGYQVYDVDGVVVGVIGLTTEHLCELIRVEYCEGLRVKDPVETAKYHAQLIEPEVDLTILLTHQGLEADRRLAEEVPYIDMIIGGHSGRALEQPLVVNGVLITRTHGKTKSLGRVDVLVDQEKNQIVDYTYQLIRTWVADARAPMPQVTRKLREYQRVAEAKLDQKIGTLARPLTKKWGGGECNLGNFAADVPAERFGVDIGLQNWGGLRRELEGPDILVRDIWELFPFSNTWTAFELTGEQVLTLFERNCELEGEYLAVSKSVRYTFDSSRPKGQRLLSASIRGRPVDREKSYTLVTCDFIFGHAQDVFGFPKEQIESWRKINLIDRDIYIDYIREHKVIDFKVEDRIVDVGEK